MTPRTETSRDGILPDTPWGRAPGGPVRGTTAMREPEAPRQSRPVVARLVRPAFGLAIATVLALGLGLFAGYHACFDPASQNTLFVWLLGENFLPGYGPTAAGAFAGLLWGAGLGYALGWSIAFAHDALLTACMRAIALRERLRASRDFLDDLR